LKGPAKPAAAIPTAPVPKVRRVTRPRGSSSTTVRTIVQLPKKVRLAAELAATARGSSLSQLLAGGISRCAKDGIWSTRVRQTVARNVKITPPTELVDICNQLLAMGMVLEELMRRCPEPAAIDEASRIYLDAKVRIEELRGHSGC